MKSHSIVRFLVGLGAGALSVACGEPRAARDVDAVGTSECRSYAAAGSVRLGGAGGDISCDFDAVARRHECRVAAGGATVLTSADYESVADFVEAGRFIGKVTSLSETRTENGAVQRLTHHYDELGRLLRSIEDKAGRTLVHAYADYDAHGRPRRERLSGPSTSEVDCSALEVSIDYADTEGTVSRRFRRLHAAECGFAERTLVEYYDGRGNRVAIDQADGSGVATVYEARRDGSTREVCL
jgi:hypothetical protein